jgi:RNA polymerase sigma factor (sigma-70 family)
MARHNSGTILRQIRALVDAGTVCGLTDGQLLERFLAGRDEVAELAFTALVQRHGPMVLGVCRRLVADPHEAEDAFQATFLVLVRKAGSIRVEGSVGRWLFGVASRVAVRARSDARRRRGRERSGLDRLEPGSAESAASAVDRAELRTILAEELVKLPARFRAAVVLCDLEGSSHEEAARRLGWAVGTVKSRLSRARALLRPRLTRRGLAPSDPALAPPLLPAALPRHLVEATTRIARSLLAGRAAAGGIGPSTVMTLTQGVLQAMFLTKLKLAAVAILLLVAGSAALVGPATAQRPSGTPGIAPIPVPTAIGAGETARRDDQLDVTLLERAWVEAIPRRDAAIVDRILADDFEGIDPVGNVFTKATYLPDLRNGVFSNQPIELDEIKVRLYGTTAVVTSRIKIHGYPSGGRMTNVYASRRGRWQCVASHASGLGAGNCPGLGAMVEVFDLRADRAARQPAQAPGQANQCMECHAVGPRSELPPHHADPARPAQKGDRIAQIRPRFPCNVERIYVGIGEVIHQGDPLVDLLSFDLAEAKSAYEMAKSQWTRDKKVLDYKKPLAEFNTIPKGELTGAENDETQSRLKLKLAKDKLLIYGLSDREIADIDKEDGPRRARLTLRSPVTGTVERACVLGNHYDLQDVLMAVRVAPSEKSPVP